MKKRLNTDQVQSELRGESAFFPGYKGSGSTPNRTPEESKPAPSPIPGLTEKPEKYTTHLEPSLVKQLKLFAVEKDLKDYQVIKKALLLYFKHNK